MIRKLVFASFLGVFGFFLYAQNTQNNNVSNTGAAPRSPNARVTVTPGPQGLPIVESSASAWPLGQGGEGDLNFWLNGAQQTAAAPADSPTPPPSNPSVRPPNGKPVFEPPPMGGLPSFAAPRTAGRPAALGPDTAPPESPNPKAPDAAPVGDASPRQENGAAASQSAAPPRNGSSAAQAPSQETAPQGASPRNGAAGGTAARTPRQNPPPAAQSPRQDAAAKKTVVVPSPVHYDRAGRRVIDPSWQETLYQIIQAEREAQEAARKTPAAPEEAPAQEAAGADQERARETIILVPGPAMWRIRGTLTAAKGMLALEDADGVLWYLPGLDRYIGYIEGLDAGEAAVLEGYAPARGSSQERYFQPLKLFIDEMEYDLAVPPEGMYLGGRTTVIREIGRRSGPAAPNPPEEKTPPRDRSKTARPGWDDGFEDDWYEDDSREEAVRRPRKKPAADTRPAWEHNHRSPWAPPASVLDFKVDNDSFWRDDPAKRERRERDSRELWY